MACTDKTVKAFLETNFLDRESRPELSATLRGHADWVYALAAAPDGKRIASASGDGTVRLWNTEDDTLLATLVQPAPGADDWLIVTGLGYCAASKAGLVQWRTANLKVSPDTLAALQDPDLVRQVLAGEKVPAPKLQ